MNFEEMLARLREHARTARDKGSLFERLMAGYVKTEPRYADLFDEVWRWEDWPFRWTGHDVGIDLVAKEKNGGYWAIQCKFYDEEKVLQKEDIWSQATALTSKKRFLAGALLALPLGVTRGCTIAGKGPCVRCAQND